MAFLLMNTEGVYAELAADAFQDAFYQRPEKFVEFLAKREDWKNILNRLGTGNMMKIKLTTEKFGDSDIECEIKRFLWARYDLGSIRAPLIIEPNSIVFMIAQELPEGFNINEKGDVAADRENVILTFKEQFDHLKEALEKDGVSVRLEIGREALFRLTKGHSMKVSLATDEVYGLALYPEGGVPRLLTKFDVRLTAKIILEFFVKRSLT